MTDMVEVPPERPHSGTARVIDRLVHLCAIVPYSAVALVLRAVMARSFFLAGQDMVSGTKHSLGGFDFSLPFPLRDDALRAYEAVFAASNIPPKLIAYTVCFAEFLLPVLLAIGLATRFSALALVVLTLLLGQYIAPGQFWPLHIYWYAILLVLLTCGAGKVSADYVIRRFYER